MYREDVYRDILSLNKQGLSGRKIATQLGIGKSTVNEYLAKGLPGKSSPKNYDHKKPVNHVKAAREHKAEEAKKKEYINAVQELSFRDYLSELIENRIEAMAPPPPVRVVKPAAHTSVESMVLNLSDWHFAEIVKPDGIFGLNQYNRKIGIARAAHIAESVISIKHRMEKGGGWHFPQLVICANGDMVSGTIHEIERHTDAKNIMDAVLTCGETFADTIRTLSASFERVRVFCTSGNHGRLPDAKKVQTKEPSRSWDYLIYRHAEALLQNCQNIEFEIPDAWAVMFELEKKVFYQGHGHFVKSWNSIPFYGINRMTSRLSATLARYHRPVDYWVFGHFHVHGSIENAGGEYLINPPLIGPQEFGTHTMGEATAPGQLLFGVKEGRGITHRWRIDAEENWPMQAKTFSVTKLGSKLCRK